MSSDVSVDDSWTLASLPSGDAESMLLFLELGLACDSARPSIMRFSSSSSSSENVGIRDFPHSDANPPLNLLEIYLWPEPILLYRRKERTSRRRMQMRQILAIICLVWSSWLYFKILVKKNMMKHHKRPPSKGSFSWLRAAPTMMIIKLLTDDY